MSYVPIVPSTASPEPPSPRVRELDAELRDAIARYRQQHPAVSDREVLQALGLTRRSVTGRGGDRTVALIAMGLLTLVAGVVAFFLVRGEAATDESLPTIGVAIVVVATVLGLAIVKSRR